MGSICIHTSVAITASRAAKLTSLLHTKPLKPSCDAVREAARDAEEEALREICSNPLPAPSPGRVASNMRSRAPIAWRRLAARRCTLGVAVPLFFDDEERDEVCDGVGDVRGNVCLEVFRDVVCDVLIDVGFCVFVSGFGDVGTMYASA